MILRRCVHVWLSLLVASTAYGQTSALKVITWGVSINSPEWNRVLNVSASREGCSGDPPSCIAYAAKLSLSYRVKVFLAVGLEPLDYAVQYSRLSRNAPYVAEVGIDDFVGQYRRVPGDLSVKRDLLNSFIEQLKSVNRELRFGITLYEDELQNRLLSESAFPSVLRDKVDYVHFYLHHRTNEVNYKSYLVRLKQLFPSAKLIGGAYAYDRIAYSPCAQFSNVRCTSQQELTLFQELFSEQVQLMRTKVLDAIEFYPAYFGRETEWPVWKDPETCDADRIAACLKNTLEMRNFVAKTLLQVRGVSQSGK